MDSKTKEDILKLIAQAQAAYQEAILPENQKDKGYPFAAGYLRSALEAVRYQIETEVPQ